MAGGNEAQRSDRFDLPNNMAFSFIIRIFVIFQSNLRKRIVFVSTNLIFNLIFEQNNLSSNKAKQHITLLPSGFKLNDSWVTLNGNLILQVRRKSL
jgi:hypothetical protein